MQSLAVGAGVRFWRKGNQLETAMNTQLSRWNPVKEMEQMQNRLASLWNWDPFRPNLSKEEALTVAEWSPRVDIVEDEKEIVVKAELPETKKEDVKVTVDDGVLTISGERKLEKEEKNKKYHRIESEYGSFLRSFTLPAAVLADKVSAEFKEGVLKVHLPKDTKGAAKAVDIKVS
jgi:HSP20 family protein